jgi:cysteine sulfinate desulfinase/cysteine desulfurase-like protein
MVRDHPSVSARYVDVDSDGVLDLESLKMVIGPDTAVVSVMTANNETGVVQPLDGVARCGEASRKVRAWSRTPTPSRRRRGWTSRS